MSRLGLGFALALSLTPGCAWAFQGGGRVSEFFEGRTVVVKLDMPGSQQGVDLFPQREQPLDMKSYSNRLKQFGVSLRNGDSAMVTKVKIKDSIVEFQLAGGGYGSSGDDTDTSVHFTPTQKSGREKDLESQIKSESNADKRRSLQRELDDMRSNRERHDRHEQDMAARAAEEKKQMVAARRMQGGSRFNLKMEGGKWGDSVTPQLIMAALDKYVVFSAPGATAAQAVPSAPLASQPATQDPGPGLHKGLTREQVEAMYGPANEAHESTQNGLTMVSCSYRQRDTVVKCDFVNGVLVQYNVSSR